MLNIGCDYSVFKSDIKPVWEDGTNKKGGRWLIKDNGLLDQYWMDIVTFFSLHHDVQQNNTTFIFLVIEYDWRNV